MWRCATAAGLVLFSHGLVDRAPCDMARLMSSFNDGTKIRLYTSHWFDVVMPRLCPIVPLPENSARTDNFVQRMFSRSSNFVGSCVLYRRLLILIDMPIFRVGV